MLRAQKKCTNYNHSPHFRHGLQSQVCVGKRYPHSPQVAVVKGVGNEGRRTRLRQAIALWDFWSVQVV